MNECFLFSTTMIKSIDDYFSGLFTLFSSKCSWWKRILPKDLFLIILIFLCGNKSSFLGKKKKAHINRKLKSYLAIRALNTPALNKKRYQSYRLSAQRVSSSVTVSVCISFALGPNITVGVIQFHLISTNSR